MQRYIKVFITINSVHVSGGSPAHHQELKTVYTTLGICRTFVLLTAIVSELKQHTHDRDKKQKKLNKYPMLFIQF
jgi:hypothetical protein